MTTEQFIRDAAARGWSRAQTGAALQISMGKMRLILELLPDVVWPAPNKSMLTRQAREAARGHCSPAQRSHLADMRRRQTRTTYEVGGRTGTLTELAAFAPVPICTIRRRLSKGMPRELAFTLPPIPAQLRRQAKTLGISV